MSEIEALQTQVRCLENECRQLRQTLRDQFAMAALTGLVSYYGDQSHIVDRDSRTSIHFAAFCHADDMLAAREGEKP